MEICGVLDRQPERKICGWSIHAGEPGGKGWLSLSCVDGETVTSRASEGVKDGRASKIGVVSGEAMVQLAFSGSRSYRPRNQFAVVQRLALHNSVRSSIFGVVKIYFPARRVFSTRLHSPIPTTVPCTLQNVRTTVDPKTPCRRLSRSFQSSGAPPFRYRSSPSRGTPTHPLVKTVPV